MGKSKDDILPVRLFVGLGNPGDTYELTYHNVGAMALHHIVKRFSHSKLRRDPLRRFVYVQSGRIVFAALKTTMNESGGAIVSALKYFSLQPEALFVFHDDADILLGNYRIHFGRGSAGHHGIESIIRALKTKSFWRVRIGVAAHKHRVKAGDFVLRPIAPRDRKILYSVFEKIAEKLMENESPEPSDFISENGRLIP